MKTTVPILAGFLLIVATAASAAPPVLDSDSDGVPDSVERAFGQDPYSPDSYPDTDGDGIPDFIEENLTNTDPAIDDSVLCAGTGGASNLTGQWDTRITNNLAAPVDFKTEYLLSASICQNGGLTAFAQAYADSVTFDGTNFFAEWTNPDETVTVNAVYTAGAGAFLMGRLEGTIAFDTTSYQFRADRRAMTPPASSTVSAIYGLQVKELLPSDDAIDRPGNPSNLGGQMVVGGAKGTVATLYPDDGTPMAGYYVPSVGALFFKNQFTRISDADGDTNADDTITDTVDVYALGLEAPTGKVGGMFRGAIDSDTSIDLDFATNPGIDSRTFDSFDAYAKTQAANVYFATVNRPAGAQTILALDNVPTSADQISIAGAGLASTDLVGGTSGMTMDGAIKVRSRLPGFTDGEAVGLSGNGTNLNITNISYSTTPGTLLTNGTYTFTITGDGNAGNPTTYGGNYTQGNPLLPVATGSALDNTTLSESTPITGVRPGKTHTLTWNAVAGAAQYIIRGWATDSPNEQWWRFTTGATMTMDPRLFDPNRSYKLQIEARAGTSGTASLNRSRTNSYEIVTGATFLDVPTSHIAWRFIEALNLARITSGCDADNYCPDTSVTRAQMAVFLERGMRGYTFVPPAATGTVFNDVGAADFAASFIEQLANDGITSGCGGGNYCPNTAVDRAQMAVFLLRAKYGSGYSPSACTVAPFADVPTNHFACAWIQQLAAEGITSGCGGGNYCPDTAVSRWQMAVFLQRTFGLPFYESMN